MMHIEKFTASEASDLTGMTQVAQRDHRRRFPKWMAPQGRKPTYDFFEILQMAFVISSGKLGIGPVVAWEQSEWVAHGALYFALICPGCIQGDLGSQYTAPNPTPEDIHDYTARQVFQELNRNWDMPNIGMERFAFLWGDGSEYFGRSIDDWRENAGPDDSRLGQPFITVDLPFFGKSIVDKLPRPAYRVGSAFEGE